MDEIHKKFGKAVLVLDNASIHTSQRLRWTSSTSLKATLLYYIPPYTPELNPIEVQWRMIKKATANMLYESTDVMKDSAGCWKAGR